jgi:hypothetical protein
MLSIFIIGDDESNNLKLDSKKSKIIQHTTIQTSIQRIKPKITLEDLLINEIKDEKKEKESNRQVMLDDIQHRLHRAYVSYIYIRYIIIFNLF